MDAAQQTLLCQICEKEPHYENLHYGGLELGSFIPYLYKIFTSFNSFHLPPLPIILQKNISKSSEERDTTL